MDDLERLHAAADAFWRFSLALYARPQVAAALIALQDRGGHDVNVALYALWLGLTRGRRLSTGELAGAIAAVAPLNEEAVRPLRALRRRLKVTADDALGRLRVQVAAVELAAERQVQARLAELASSATSPAEADRIAAARGNLARQIGADIQSPEARVVLAAAAALARLA